MCQERGKRPQSHPVLNYKRSLPFSGGNGDGEVGKDRPEEPDKSKATETATVVDRQKAWQTEEGDSS